MGKLAKIYFFPRFCWLFWGVDLAQKLGKIIIKKVTFAYTANHQERYDYAIQAELNCRKQKKMKGQGSSNIKSAYLFASLMFTNLSNPFFLSTKDDLQTTR